MNVSALARKLKMTTSEFLEKLPQMGFDIGAKAIKIDDNLVDKIIQSFENERKKQQVIIKQDQIKEVKLQEEKPTVEKEIELPETIIVRELAEKLNVPLVKVMSELMKNGIIVSLNEKIDYETAAIIGEDLGYKSKKQVAEDIDKEVEVKNSQKLKNILDQDKDSTEPKPPVVVVMGHVDHGKTKLLDAIRKTNVIDQESGGITQHIGAYQVKEKERPITFLDTPGHEAFKSMRSRGSQVADIAIIVVAADEGLKPQTIEVFELIQKEKIPFIVAINKIDKEGADIERVKKELSEINVVPEDWGGKTICVPISAKKEQGIDDLLEMVYLVSDIANLKVNSKRPAIGTIIESRIDKGEGPVATVLISAGILKIGDYVEIGKVGGKIRTMKNFKGETVSKAPPSTPVKILGLKSIPQVGDILEVLKDKKLIKQRTKESRLNKIKPTVKSNNNHNEEQENGKETSSLSIILKADVLGSQEAIIEALNNINVPETKIDVIKKGLGIISEVDILDAFAEKALIIGFHVKTKPAVDKLAKEKNVEVLQYEIIYKIIEELESRLKELTKPGVVRIELGKAEAIKIFKSSKQEMIVGCKVLVGKIISNTKVKIIRDNETIGFNDLIQLQSGRQDVSEVIIGQECGFKLKGKFEVKEGDILEIYKEEN